MPRCVAVGPRQAAIAIVGEAPGAEEEKGGLPFIGASGQELTRMLSDAGIERSACFVTNLCMDRPSSNDIEQWVITKKKGPKGFVSFRGRLVAPHIPEEHERLVSELRSVGPNVVLALGDTALWALCPHSGTGKWRGSLLESDVIPGLKVIPAYHPAFILRKWPNRWITVQDFRRAKKESLRKELILPEYNFILGPDKYTTCNYLNDLIKKAMFSKEKIKLVIDLEIFHKEILCVGLATSKRDAICIPFISLKGYWFDPETHTEVVSLLSRVLQHPNIAVCNQNIAFDKLFLFWRFFIKFDAAFDTMVGQGVLFPSGGAPKYNDETKNTRDSQGELPKNLGFLGSMYAEYYLYWKDDGKFWISYESDEKIWRYNCLDCTYTFEVWEAQEATLKNLNLTTQMDFMLRVMRHVETMQIQGVLVDTKRKQAMAEELWALERQLHLEIEFLTGQNLRGPKGDLSSAKLANFFYTQLKLPVILSKLKKPTCDDEALKKIGKREPWLLPLIERINMIRSYGTAIDVVASRTDDDSRWRTSYNVVGTETYRFSSSANPFNTGLNLQNLSGGKEIV